MARVEEKRPPDLVGNEREESAAGDERGAGRFRDHPNARSDAHACRPCCRGADMGDRADRISHPFQDELSHFARYFDELAQIDFGICSFWGARPALPIESAPVVSDVPTLVLVGDTDPFTPPTWAKLTAATLSQSQIAEFPGLGHGVFRADFITKYCEKNYLKVVPTKTTTR